MPALWLRLNEGLLSEEQRPPCFRTRRRRRRASTKGCSQRSSDCRLPTLTLRLLSRLNEGLLSEEQRPRASARPSPTWPRLNEGLLSEEQRHVGRSRLTPSGRGLNEGLLSEEQRRRPRNADNLQTRWPQRRAALRGAATRQQATLSTPLSSLNEGLLSEEQRPPSRHRRGRLGEPQRRAALRGAATDAHRRVTGIDVGASTKGCSQRSSDPAGRA